MARVGIIGGSGLYEIEGIADLKTETIGTPYGMPSENFHVGTLDGVEVVFLPRHGKGHHISPSEINYRANIFGMKKLGVEAIISVSACGSMRETIKPMDFVLPDQFIDRTSKRESTFFKDGIVVHASFAEPVSSEIAAILYDSAKDVGVEVHRGGIYLNIEGPQFSTKAESRLYREWGVDIIGMTNVTEAKLAREAEISYATLAAVTDYDCWHETEEAVTVDAVMECLRKNVDNARKILKVAIPRVGKLAGFSAADALKHAIVTDPAHIPEQVKKDLGIIIGKYFSS